MVRLFPVLMVVFIVCFGAGVAQSDIFVRQNSDDKAKTGEVRSGGVYLRPFRDNDKALQKNTARYRSQVVTDVQQRVLNEDLKLLQAWTKAERKPRTAEEILSYARAHRAPALMDVLQNRAKVIPAIEATYNAQLSAYQAKVFAQAGDPQAVLDFEAMMAEMQGGSASAGVYKAFGAGQTAEPRVRRIYRPKSVTTTPSRVYRDYR